MLESILFLDRPGSQLGELRGVFEAQIGSVGDVRAVHSIDELLRRISDRDRHHLVIVHDEIGDGERTGLEVVVRLRETHPEVPVVVLAEEGDVKTAARAIEAGATDFFVRGDQLPARVATLLGKLRGLFEAFDRNRMLSEQNARLRLTIQARFKIIGESPQILALIEKIQRIAKVPRPVLIEGERGTGKELVARAIHFSAGSRSRPIVTVNCAAFNKALLESELFGHEKGAFTGADSRRRGKFEQADDGTLFLDEIGNMSLPFQQKILRVVEYGTFTRVGGVDELSTGARILAATNVDLRAKIETGEFLSDLYDRLAFEVIKVPPLRERDGDVEVLSYHFLKEFAREIPAFGGKTLSSRAIARLRGYSFPGNVRELKNIIERAAYRDTTNDITPEDLGLLGKDEATVDGGSFREKTEAFARRLIDEAMSESKGNQAQAARLLGLSYHQFRYYYRKLVQGRIGE